MKVRQKINLQLPEGKGARKGINEEVGIDINTVQGGTRGKELAYQCRRYKRCCFNPWAGKIPWRRTRQPTPVFLPGESHEQRSLVGCSP